MLGNNLLKGCICLSVCISEVVVGNKIMSCGSEDCAGGESWEARDTACRHEAEFAVADVALAVKVCNFRRMLGV